MNRLLSLIGFFVLIGLFGCSSENHLNRVNDLKKWMEPNGKIKVLSTTSMIDDLVKEVGGAHVDSTVLISSELDPHSYQLVKGDDEKLSFADVIFFNGLGLEHGASLQSYLSQSKKAISLGGQLHNHYPSLILYYKKQIDPHIWMDVSLWSKIVPYIVESLQAKDPSHAKEYESNGEKLIAQMLETHHQIRSELQAIPSYKRYLVTSHDAFNYFTRSYLSDNEEAENDWKLRFVAPEGLAPESQISPFDIQEIILHLARYEIHVIFSESNVNRDSIRKIVQASNEKQLNVRIANISLFADAMGRPGSDGDTYLKMMKHNSRTIATELNHDENLKRL